MQLSDSPVSTLPVRTPVLTHHARERMCTRQLTGKTIQLVLRHGRVVHTRGAAIYVIGRKEVSRLGRSGVNLAPYEGVQVVCTPDSKSILTVYKDSNFRGLKPRGRRRWKPTTTVYPLAACRQVTQ